MAKSTNGNQPKKEFDTDAYVDWEMELLRQEGRFDANGKDQPKVWVHPVFVRLCPTENDAGELRYTHTVIALQNLQGNEKILIENHELEYLEAIKKFEVDESKLYSLEPSVYCFLYRRVYHVAELYISKLVEIVNVGPAVQIRKSEPPFVVKPVTISGRAKILGKPVVAIIDDSIGFLNQRFSKKPIRGRNDWTRFQAFWYQAKESADTNMKRVLKALAAYPSVSLTEFSISRGAVTIGASFEVTRAPGVPPVINDERTVYSFLDRYLTGEQELNISGMAQSHGTAILDVATGDEPGGEFNEVDLIGVQLPPHSIKDTSGKRFESYILQGLRWIINQTLKIQSDRNEEIPDLNFGVPLIVNISLGSYAGPKNGNGFLESQIEREVQRYRNLSGDSPIRIVQSFGNGYRHRQTALFEQLDAGKSKNIDWCVLPDDRTASYIEMRAPESSSIEIWIKPPGQTGRWYDWPKIGEYQSIMNGDNEIGRFYGDTRYMSEQQSRATIAILPTYRHEVSLPVSSSGPWQLSVKNQGKNPANVSLQIQRDDTPSPHNQAGRQSYFDHKDAHEWDPETRDFSMPTEDCPITRDATHGAQVSALDDNIYSVGAVFQRTYGDENVNNAILSSFYSAKGSNTEILSTIDGPVISAVADESRILPGIGATGTLSGSTIRIGGTSTAAAQVTRALTLQFLGSRNAPKNQKDEIMALLNTGRLPNSTNPRLGYGTLKQ